MITTQHEVIEQNHAIELAEMAFTLPSLRPIKILDVEQPAMRETTRELNCWVNGNMLRIGAGTVFNLTSFGTGANSGRLSNSGKTVADLRVKCLDGVTRILPQGLPVEIVAE